MISTRRLTCLICLMVILASLISDNGLVLASSKKKFLKGFILGALLSKSHGIPVIYMQDHGGHHKHGGYGY